MISIIAMILVGSATSFYDEIHAEIRRTPGSIVITNLNDFDWERVDVIIETGGPARDYHHSARAEIGTVAAGETREVLLSEFKDQASLSHLLQGPSDALLYITGNCPRGTCMLADGARLLRDVPLAE